MAKCYIKPELEFFDVICAFPVIKEILIKENFNIENISEGVSIYSHLKSEAMTEKEIEVFIKKLNLDINAFLLDESTSVFIPNGFENEIFLEEQESFEEEE